MNGSVSSAGFGNWNHCPFFILSVVIKKWNSIFLRRIFVFAKHLRAPWSVLPVSHRPQSLSWCVSTRLQVRIHGARYLATGKTNLKEGMKKEEEKRRVGCVTRASETEVCEGGNNEREDDAGAPEEEVEEDNIDPLVAPPLSYPATPSLYYPPSLVPPHPLNEKKKPAKPIHTISRISPSFFFYFLFHLKKSISTHFYRVLYFLHFYPADSFIFTQNGPRITTWEVVKKRKSIKSWFTKETFLRLFLVFF